MKKIDGALEEIRVLTEIANELSTHYTSMRAIVSTGNSDYSNYFKQVEVGFHLYAPDRGWIDTNDRVVRKTHQELRALLSSEEHLRLAKVVIDSAYHDSEIDPKVFADILRSFIQTRAQSLEIELLKALKDTIKISSNISQEEDK